VFRLNAGSGVPIYRQLMQQVRREVLLGRLQPGDQLPTVKEVVDAVSVNPNTVAKAYRELEHEGVVRSRQGVGTFIAATAPTAPTAAPPVLFGSLARWVQRARTEGLSAEQMHALLALALDEPAAEEDSRSAAGGVA
jgi:GntR family transcriptional regulator